MLAVAGGRIVVLGIAGDDVGEMVGFRDADEPTFWRAGRGANLVLREFADSVTQFL